MSKREKGYIIGIDEVGRGSLAGPIVVAAVAATTKFRIQNSELRTSKLAKLRDSKKLSPKQREDWFKFIKKSAYAYRQAGLCYSIACYPIV